VNKKVLILIFALLLVYGSFLIGGVRVANDFPFVSRENLIEGFSLPQTWSSRTAEGLGEYVVSTLWAWPVDFLYGLGGKLNFSFALIERVLGVGAILMLGVVSMRKLLQSFDIKGWGVFFGTIFYLANTYILLVIDGGQFAIGLAYAWMPMAYLALNKAVKGGLREKILAGLGVSILGFFDIRFIYILFILFGLKFIIDILFLENKYKSLVLRSSRLFKRYLSVGFVVVLIFVGLNIYWILPALLVKAPELPATYQRASQASLLSFANLGHSLLLLQPHGFKNVFGNITELRAVFIFVPILVFLSPILKRKSKLVGFWLIVSLIGIFLVKGADPPLPGVYQWFFTNIVGFSLFRDPTKFYFLVALAYSVLISITVEELVKRFDWSFKIRKTKVSIVALGLIAYFLLLISPIFTGKMTGTFLSPILEEEYSDLANIFREDKNFGRILYVPSRPPLGYASVEHPIVEASRLVQKRPFASGTVGTYELFNFLREASFMGEIFDIAGIKYIVYPFPDERREELKQDNIDYYDAFSEQIRNLDWVDDKMIYHTPVSTFITKKSQDRFFTAKNLFCVVGSERIYSELVEIQEFQLADNPIVYMEERPGMGEKVKRAPCTYILFEKEAIDLAITNVSKNNFIFPAENLGFDPDESRWWKREESDLIGWHDFLQQKYGIDNLDFSYGGGWAVSEADSSSLKIQNEKFKKGDILLARVMSSGWGGKVEFYQDKEKIGEIDTKIEKPETVEIQLTGYEEIPDRIFSYNKADLNWKASLAH